MSANAQERVRHPLGEMEVLAAKNGVLVAAPHGTFDANSAPIAIDAARALGSGYVVAWRFVADKVRINVNRPTEGAFLACREEPQSDRAQDVYRTYRDLVAKAAGANALRLYVEIHGNSNPRAAQNIEVASVGISAAQAQAVKDAYPAMLARVRGRVGDFPELALLIEPVDRIIYAAACAKKLGVLGEQPKALHFEFPRAARERHTLAGAAMLVAEIARLIAEIP